MKGWSIFKHSVSMVLRNWREALKIGLLPILGLFVGALAIFLPLATSIEGGAPAGGAVIAVFLFVIVAAALMLNVIVSWHRFVLLEEYPQSWIPTWQGGRVLGYLGRLLLLIILGFILLLPVMIVIGFSGVMGGIAGGETGAGIAAVAVLVPIYVFAALAYYRIAVILPSGAVDQPLTLGEAWDKTHGSMGAIFVMLLLYFVAQMAVEILAAGVAFISAPLAVIFSVVLSMIMAMVGVSLLTTLYGHYVDGRPID